ncbi:MAG: hypothetical protein ACYTKD_17525 [Planctomycetota bacterium]|jgi:hypothetical protein
MRKAAPWIAVGAAVVLAALLVADIVIVSMLRSEVSSLAARVLDPRGLRVELAAARAEAGDLAERLAALEKSAREKAARPSAPLIAPGTSDMPGTPVIPVTPGAEEGGREQGPPKPAVGPPRGTVVATFDKSDEGWSTPEWATGSVLRATQRGMFRRGKGALALGYVYGDTPPAAMGPVSPGGKVRHIRFHARTRAREMFLGIGVVEEGGARYELKGAPLKPEEGWRLVSVPPGSMGPAKGSRDADRRLDLAKIVGVYVVDRTKDAAGGNVLLIDDLTIELFP